MKFGIISEGATDQVVLRHLLGRYFNNPDINVVALQPVSDASDPERRQGGWPRVIDFLTSGFLADSLSSLDYIIIQIDTDVCQDYGVEVMEYGRMVGQMEICKRTKEVLLGHINNELLAKYAHKMLFAISHESMECWLLPLFTEDKKMLKVTEHCCDALNQAIKSKGVPWAIDCKSKRAYQYNSIVRLFTNREHIVKSSEANLSFKLFIEQLEAIA